MWPGVNFAQASSLGRYRAMSFAGSPWRKRKLVRWRYAATSGITIHQGLFSLKSAEA